MAWNSVLLWTNIVVFLLPYQAFCETCLPSWISYKQSCVRKYHQQRNYDEAAEQCVQRGGRLIAKLPKELAMLLIDHRTGFWVSPDLVEEEFSISTLEPERKKRQATGYDDDSDICYYLEGTDVVQAYCYERKGFICEKDFMPPSTACLQGSTNNTEKNDWYTARQYCQCNGSDLYSYQDQREEQVALEDDIGRNQVWIGLSREPDSNIFRWSDGSPLTYTNWSPGQPETNNSEALCVAQNGQDLKWEVADCSLNLFYMCKPAKWCDNDTCNNRGSCSQDSVSGDISCSCDHGYRGDFCDERITCDKDTCKNGGFCSQDGVNGVFRCSCVHGYKGLTCEERITCDYDTCKNGGFCSQDGVNGVFRCSCVHGYKGLTCEETSCESSDSTSLHSSHLCIKYFDENVDHAEAEQRCGEEEDQLASYTLVNRIMSQNGNSHNTHSSFWIKRDEGQELNGLPGKSRRRRKRYESDDDNECLIIQNKMRKSKSCFIPTGYICEKNLTCVQLRNWESSNFTTGYICEKNLTCLQGNFSCNLSEEFASPNLDAMGGNQSTTATTSNLTDQTTSTPEILCADDTCNYRGTCSQDSLNGVFRCSCDHGYGGPTCSEKTLNREDKSRQSVPSTQDGENDISNCTSNPDCPGSVSSERIGGACSVDWEYIYVAAAILGTTLLITAILATTACLITWAKRKSKREKMQIKLKQFQLHTDGVPTDTGENPV